MFHKTYVTGRYYSPRNIRQWNSILKGLPYTKKLFTEKKFTSKLSLIYRTRILKSGDKKYKAA